MSTDLVTTKGVLGAMAERYGIQPDRLQPALEKLWSVKEREILVSLCIVANQYGLNPFTREIYAFTDKGGKVVPVVGVDGWIRIINEHPMFDGLETTTASDGESVTCTIWRKDRTRPITVTEYMRECKRNTDPWSKCPLRMLRHRAIIQCARVAFGFTGIYEQDEAETFAAPMQAVTADTVPGAITDEALDAEFTEAQESILSAAPAPKTTKTKQAADAIIAAARDKEAAQ